MGSRKPRSRAVTDNRSLGRGNLFLSEKSALAPYLFDPDSYTASLQSSSEDYPRGSMLPEARVIVRSAEDLIYRLTGPAKDIARAQLYAGARAVEILSLTVTDMEESGFACINARKGSSTRTCYLPHLLPYWRRAIDTKTEQLFPTFTYGKYRHALKAASRDFLPTTRCHYIWSNLFRRASAELARYLAKGSRAAASHTLGHVNPNSTKSYLTGKDT